MFTRKYAKIGSSSRRMSQGRHLGVERLEDRRLCGALDGTTNGAWNGNSPTQPTTGVYSSPTTGTSPTKTTPTQPVTHSPTVVATPKTPSVPAVFTTPWQVRFGPPMRGETGFNVAPAGSVGWPTHGPVYG
jgi:hypothetical protein